MINIFTKWFSKKPKETPPFLLDDYSIKRYAQLMRPLPPSEAVMNTIVGEKDPKKYAKELKFFDNTHYEILNWGKITDETKAKINKLIREDILNQNAK